MRTKDKNMDKHTIRRAKERYGVDLTKKDLQSIIAKIKRQKAQFLYRQSLTRTVWKVEYMGKNFIVVYYPHKQKIRTILTEDMARKNMGDKYDEIK